MTYRGTVKSGVIVLDDAVTLPEGAKVEVATDAAVNKPTSWNEVLKDVVGKAEGLPSDMARNHDHYLHGAPKR